MNIHALKQRVLEYLEETGLSRLGFSKKAGMPYATFRDFVKGRTKSLTKSTYSKISSIIEEEDKKRVNSPKEAPQPPQIVNEENVKEARVSKKVIEDVEKLRYVLLLLEAELKPFVRGDVQVREFLRANLNFKDVAYLGTLLAMLGEEGEFQRWSKLTTNKFNYLKGR